MMGKRPLSEAASGCRGGPFWTLRSGLYTYNVSSASARLRIHISVAGLHGRWHLQAWAPGESFVDLGEGIAQSLRADCLLLAPVR
jgi:hypothetical protein